jgi:hypothetical protein
LVIIGRFEGLSVPEPWISMPPCARTGALCAKAFIFLLLQQGFLFGDLISYRNDGKYFTADFRKGRETASEYSRTCIDMRHDNARYSADPDAARLAINAADSGATAQTSGRDAASDVLDAHKRDRRLCAIQRASLDACVFTPIIQFWTPAVEWRVLFPAGQS